ncbi:MAG: PDZ domain-containing protein, partial [Myxococcales bacterium]|nr:PDZ domain-containing protein [Myxococcales bacterium]
MVKRRKSAGAPIGGIAVLVLGGLILLFILFGDTACAPMSGTASGVQPMELQGRWMGMGLAGSDSASAQLLGIPPTVSGVVVTQMIADPSNRSAMAGISTGDVIVGVGGTSVANLAELYTLTTSLDTGQGIQIDALRRGQPISLLLPAAFQGGVGLQP